MNKWKLMPSKSVRYTVFHINVENTTFYHKDDQLGSIKTFKVDLEQMLYSEILEFVDPLALNKAFYITLDFCPIDCKISKQQFTYLMKCLDLNIMYDDGYRELYDFRAKKEYADTHPYEEDYKFMVVDIKMTSVSLS